MPSSSPLSSSSLPPPSQQKRKHNNSSPKVSSRNRLWWMLVLSVSLYGIVWIVTTSHISFHHQHQTSTTTSMTTKKRIVNKDSNHQLLLLSKQAFVRKTSNNSTSRKQKQRQPRDVISNKKISKNRIENNKPDDDNDNTIINNTNNTDKLFLNYQLHYDRPYNITFGPFTRCTVGVVYNKRGKKPIERVPLASPLHDILNDQVTVNIQTNMKIISVGDSVLMQFHEVLEEAVGMVWNDTMISHRHVYHNAWGDHESVSISAPVAGDGVVAAFRMTGLLLRFGKGRKPPNEGPAPNGAGGWKPEHVQDLLSHKYNITLSTIEDGSTATMTRTVNTFDIMIFRIPHGWLSLNVVTKENLEEAVVLAHELFGIRTVIIHSLFFNVSFVFVHTYNVDACDNHLKNQGFVI